MQFLNDILSHLFDRGSMAKNKPEASALTSEELLELVMTTEGDVSANVYAHQLLQRFNGMDDDAMLGFFNHILALDLDANSLIAAAKAYRDSQSADDLAAISRHAEPRWQELFRRLNAVANGTVALVHMRKKLLGLSRANPELKRLDVGLKALMLSWFNSGFLVLKPIDWATSATVLEKIIAYEAVHEIESWEDLRTRLAPEDRRCFAFFHPAMPDEPLIFVEVALMGDTPRAINDVLKTPREVIRATDATTAVFYSISNCQAGLAGISFGNFLIKQVARALQRDLPQLSRFVTLSPVPGFRGWLNDQKPALHADIAAQMTSLDDIDDLLRQKINVAAAEYFLASSRADGRPHDPVARFHLGNGASLDQLNLFGDRSDKGMTQSFGLMVNYLYELDAVEKNHEDYSRDNVISASEAITALVPPPKP
ncbi:MAG: malonyl-CoA decarboxylase family protein [Alphaproteobacteria bacterium]|nr:malonyl-CoA decarboxylase family protein [Alphaproteobacteria bacterium]